MKDLAQIKLNKYLIFLVLTLVVLAILVGLTFRTILTSLNRATEIDNTSSEIFIDRQKIIDSLGALESRESVPLDLPN